MMPAPSGNAPPFETLSPVAAPAGYRIRIAGPTETAKIAQHRRAMFEEIGRPGDLDAVERAFTEWLRTRLGETYFHWVATNGEEAIGGAGVMLADWPPSPRDPRGGLGFVYNVYVEPVHRRRGLARALLEAVHQWAQARGLGALALHASEDGRPLYETLGYQPTNEMRIDFLAMARARGSAGR